MGPSILATRSRLTASLLMVFLILGVARSDSNSDQEQAQRARQLRPRVPTASTFSSFTTTTSTEQESTSPTGEPTQTSASRIEVSDFIEPNANDQCRFSLDAVDLDNDGRLFSPEYTLFITLASQGAIEVPFAELDLIFVVIFYSAACTYCFEQTGNDRCCVGSQANLDLKSEGSVNYVCRNVETALEDIFAPTVAPVAGTRSPTSIPTVRPTANPTSVPSKQPSPLASISPSASPTLAPTDPPTLAPTDPPTLEPTVRPTFEPTDAPTLGPTDSPTSGPTNIPSASPTVSPTDTPSVSPTAKPTETPTSQPSGTPTVAPTTSSPSRAPTDAIVPTNTPTSATPTIAPSTMTPTTVAPTLSPTAAPTTLSPTASPTTTSLACVTFGYKLVNQDGLSAMDIFDEVNNTIKADLIQRTEVVVREIIDEAYPDENSVARMPEAGAVVTIDSPGLRYGRFVRDEGNRRHLSAGLDRAIEFALADRFGSDIARDLIDTYQEQIVNEWTPKRRNMARFPNSYNNERNLVFYSDDFPAEIPFIIDDPFCPRLNPLTRCAIVSSRVCVVLEEGDDEEMVQQVLIDGLREAINSGSFIPPV